MWTEIVKGKLLQYCVKHGRERVFAGPYFPVQGLNLQKDHTKRVF